MKKWLAVFLFFVICIACLAAASADSPFAITETSRNEWTFFKNTGIMSRYKYFNALFNATGLDTGKGITISAISAPFEITYYEPEYYGINTDGWQSDYSDHDFYGCVMFGIEDSVLQALECKDYTLSFTLSHNGSTAKLSCRIHIADAMPKTPAGITGIEESYTILPDETITVRPSLNPAGWAGTYETRMNFYVGKSSGGGYAVTQGDGSLALVAGDGGDPLVIYTSDSASVTVTGKAPGYYTISSTIFLPYANAFYDMRIPLTVLNPGGSAPINKPMISYNIDNDIYGDENGSYYHEITRYKTNLDMQVYCAMYDSENTGVLNDLVAGLGAQAVTGKAVFTDSDNKKYEYPFTGYAPYTGAGETLSMLSSSGTIHLKGLPAGDYLGTITLNWYGTQLVENVLLHRGYNPDGDPTGVSGIDNLYILHIGDKLTLPMAVVPSGWTAPQPMKWYSGVTSQSDWNSTSVYYENDSWMISQGTHFTCRRTESASGFTDIYTAKDSGFYTCSVSMQCADYEVSKVGYVMVLNQDGSIPDGGLSESEAKRIATIIIPAGTVKVESEAFANIKDNAVVYFPGSVNEIAQNAFSGVGGLVVLGYRNSAAQRFAQLNGYSFVPVQN